jgi:hypothetical protein
MTTVLEPRTTSVDPWWTCPGWCTDCAGGATHRFADGVEITMSRIHRHTLWQVEAQSATSADTIQVALVWEQIEDPHGRPLPAQTLLIVGDQTVIVDLDLANRLQH